MTEITSEIKNLINEAAIADAEVKRLTKDIIKPFKELATDFYLDNKPGKLVDTGTATCAFAEVAAYDPISPAALLAHFGGDIEKLLHCCTVSETALKTVCGTAEIEGLKGKKIGSTIRVTLKLKK